MQGPERDLILSKCAQIERALSRVDAVLGGDVSRLDDLMVADVVALNLQRACQSTIELAQHLVAALGLGLPATMADNFGLLQQHGMLAPALAARLRAMVGFRNLLVHSYDALDPEIVARVAIQGPIDLRAFAAWAVQLPVMQT